LDWLDYQIHENGDYLFLAFYYAMMLLIVWILCGGLRRKNSPRKTGCPAGEIRPGQWIGAGAERLELSEAVTRAQFHVPSRRPCSPIRSSHRHAVTRWR
jgi:hypothetical protein